MTNLDSIAQQLRDELSRLTDEKTKAEAKVQILDAELKRVEDALTALGSKPKPSKTKTSKPAPKQEEVHEAVKRILSEEGALELEPLKKKIESVLTKLGRSKMGLALRLKEVLASEELFIESPAGWKLVESEVEAAAAK